MAKKKPTKKKIHGNWNLEGARRDYEAHGVDTTTPSSTAKKAGPRNRITKAEMTLETKRKRPKRYSVETKPYGKGKAYRTTAYSGKSSYTSGWNTDEASSRDAARRKFLRAKGVQSGKKK